MILVDTSVWIDHLRSREPVLEGDRVLIHPFVLGELACGNLENRTEVLKLLGDLPAAPTATDPEVLGLIERRALMGRGIGSLAHTFWHRPPCQTADSYGRETGVSPRRLRRWISLSNLELRTERGCRTDNSTFPTAQA